MLSAALSVSFGHHPELKLDAFVPENGVEGQALVVGIHGGWWHQGHHQDLRACCLALAEHGHPSATIGFRSIAGPTANPGPEHARNGMDILSDVMVGITKAAEEATLLGWGGRSVVLLGSGSGSLIALLAAHRLSTDRSLRATAPRIRAVIACGVTPSLDNHDGWAVALAPVMDRFAGRDRHALSPLHQSPGGFPAALLLHGDKDPDVPVMLAQRFHQRIAPANEGSHLHVLAGLGHHFIEQPQSLGGRTALERILPFLTEHGRDFTHAPALMAEAEASE
jgi:pimeloyl-ACP methyl ester carboxylesterase